MDFPLKLDFLNLDFPMIAEEPLEKRTMKHVCLSLVTAIALLAGNGLATIQPATALPGQRTEDVEAWIQAHPTLQPTSGERLMVRKSNSAAQRFTFQASVFPPGRIAPTSNKGAIRTETLSFFDAANGITRDRLEESLRVIYGLDVYQDFQKARTSYSYPGDFDVAQARNRRTELQAARQGEVRIGNRFAYVIEVVQPADGGKAYSGQVQVILKSDVDKVESELRNL